MKRITSIFTFIFLFSILLHAQGEVDAQRFSKEDIYGTARYMSMGGAFGALGGDQSGIATNPAGIAVYRSSEVMGTLDLSSESSIVGDNKVNRTGLTMDNLGFVGYFPLRNDIFSVLNFGFTYNKQKSFNKNISAYGRPRSSLMDYIADRSFGIDPQKMWLGEDLPNPFETEPWLPVLGYNSYLINPHLNEYGHYYTPLETDGDRANNEIWSREWGYIDNYDFTIGTTVNGVLNLGLSLSIKEVSYSLISDYLEDFNNTGDGGYTLSNSLTTSGAGFSAKFGAIYRPINELRLGIAYHTPTWYSLSETFEAQIDHDLSAYVTDPGYEPGNPFSGRFPNSFKLRTPGKFIASFAGVFGNRFIASMDYELVNYRNMKLMPYSDYFGSQNAFYYDNEYIDKDYKSASTIKLGMEYRFTHQLYGRLGYAWIQNPYDSEFKESGDAAIAGSNTIFRIEGDSDYFTGGIGYRFSPSFYIDAALVYKTQIDDLYPFPNLYTRNPDTEEREEIVIDATPFKLKNKSIRGLMTLGYRF